jgi:hypothetical protein
MHLRQLADVGRDAPGVFLPAHPRNRLGPRLAVVIADDEAGVGLLGGPGRGQVPPFCYRGLDAWRDPCFQSRLAGSSGSLGDVGGNAPCFVAGEQGRRCARN